MSAMSRKTEQVNLFGVKCPLNWAKAKVRLEDLERGDILAVLIETRKAGATFLVPLKLRGTRLCISMRLVVAGLSPLKNRM